MVGGLRSGPWLGIVHLLKACFHFQRKKTCHVLPCHGLWACPRAQKSKSECFTEEAWVQREGLRLERRFVPATVNLSGKMDEVEQSTGFWVWKQSYEGEMHIIGVLKQEKIRASGVKLVPNQSCRSGCGDPTRDQPERTFSYTLLLLCKFYLKLGLT